LPSTTAEAEVCTKGEVLLITLVKQSRGEKFKGSREW
jgi:hypothetical protein